VANRVDIEENGDGKRTANTTTKGRCGQRLATGVSADRDGRKEGKRARLSSSFFDNNLDDLLQAVFLVDEHFLVVREPDGAFPPRGAPLPDALHARECDSTNERQFGEKRDKEIDPRVAEEEADAAGKPTLPPMEMVVVTVPSEMVKGMRVGRSIGGEL